MHEESLFQEIKQARSHINKLKLEAEALEADPFSNVHKNVSMKEYIKNVSYSLSKNEKNLQKRISEFADERNRQKIERNKLPNIRQKDMHANDLSLLGNMRSGYKKQRKNYKHPVNSLNGRKSEQSTKVENVLDLSIQNRPMKIHSTDDRHLKMELSMEHSSHSVIPIDFLRLKQEIFGFQKSHNAQAWIHPSNPNRGQSRGHRKSHSRKTKLINLNNSFQSKQPSKMEYSEIVDKYSKHEFMIIRAKLVADGPEYASFVRIYQSILPRIKVEIERLESILAEKQVSYAKFDGKKLAFLCLKGELSQQELVSCLIDEKNLLKQRLIASYKFFGPKGKQRSLMKIQSFARMVAKRSRYVLMKNKAKILQTFFRKNLAKLELEKRIHARNSKILQRFEDRQEELTSKWKSIQNTKRIEIHLNSLEIDEEKRLSIENFGERENIQLSRIFRLRDENLIIIYVSSCEEAPQLINYYHRMLDLAAIPKYRDRLIFFTPSEKQKFPDHFSVTKLLYYSSRTLRQLKVITEDLPTLIYPGQPSNELVKICDYLECYLFSGAPSTVKQFTARSQTIRFLRNLSIQCLPSAMEMYDYGEFFNTFAVMIIKNPEIATWVLKIDDEFGGRGIAYLEVGKSKVIQILLSKVDYQSTQSFYATDIATEPQNQEITLSIRDYLRESIRERLKIATPSLYRSYEEFMGKFIKKGGIIEAKPPNSDARSTLSSPSISFCLHPTGEHEITATYQKMLGSPFRPYACSFPQKSLDMKLASATITRICESFKIRKLFGHFTIDFLHFKDRQKQVESTWVIDIDPYINNFTAAYYMFDVLIAGNFFPQDNVYLVEKDQSKFEDYSVDTMPSEAIQNNLVERSFVFLPHFFNPQIFNIKIKQFFKQARIERLNFDIGNKEGLLILLLDQLTSGMISLMAVSSSQQDSILLVKRVLEFINKVSQIKNVSYGHTNIEPSTDQIPIRDMSSFFVTLARKSERANAKQKAIRAYENNCSLEFIC